MRNWITLLESADAAPQPILIVVHPGSACGSADFNLGKFQARADREFLASDISNWHGGIVVVDGEFSDELPEYSQLNTAILSAVERAKSNGLLAIRIFACDNMTDHWPAKVGNEVLAHIPRETPLELTGAWYFSNNEAGCVNAVYDQAHALGFTRINIRDSAVKDPMGDGNEDEDYEESDDEQPDWGNIFPK
jgi:hypothetical protein